MSDRSLLEELRDSTRGGRRWLWSAGASVEPAALLTGSSLGLPLELLRNSSVLLATAEQLPTCLAAIELDGIARRIVLCPPDVPKGHLRAILSIAEVDAVVGDREICGGARFVPTLPRPVPVKLPVERSLATEWVLLTSGTTGMPKLVRHTLATLTAPMRGRLAVGRGGIWSTFYDTRRYGGLQIFLRAVLGGGSMVLSSPSEPVAEFAARTARHQVTHISGTPSHWRRFLIGDAAKSIAPRYVRLSGEIADQTIIDRLRTVYPGASVSHAFASTEAGVAFEVDDGRAGFPSSYLALGGEVELRVHDSSLRIRSNRTARGYLGGIPFPQDTQGFVDTGDIVEPHGDRLVFFGRRGGIINVGGQKVHPEEVEEVINGHPAVRMTLIRARPSPIVGAVVVAEVLLNSETPQEPDQLKAQLFSECRRRLPAHKVPATIKFVSNLDVAPSGKLMRAHA